MRTGRSGNGGQPGGTGEHPSGGRPEPGGPGHTPRGGENASWTIFSYLLAGMIAYGGIGWLVAHWTGHPLIFPLGMLVGLAISMALVIHRYGRY